MKASTSAKTGARKTSRSAKTGARKASTSAKTGARKAENPPGAKDIAAAHHSLTRAAKNEARLRRALKKHQKSVAGIKAEVKGHQRDIKALKGDVAGAKKARKTATAKLQKADAAALDRAATCPRRRRPPRPRGVLSYGSGRGDRYATAGSRWPVRRFPSSGVSGVARVTPSRPDPRC
jgi:hypothetical protein